jgi:hypothetical protein
MKKDYKCSDTAGVSSNNSRKTIVWACYYLCPCRGGDTASAKRMFDAVLAGCIPVVSRARFVPLSDEIEAR